MKRMKASLKVAMSSVLIAVLAACSTGGNNTPAPEQNPGKGGQVDSEIPKQVTIKYSRWASGEEEKQFRGWLDEFEDAHPHIKVEASFLPWETYVSKIKTDLISGAAADVTAFSSSEWAAFAHSNVFVDLNTLPDATAVFGQLSESTVSAFNIDGKQLGAPIGVGRRVPFINKDLFNKANVPLPSQSEAMTVAQWVEMMEQVQAGLDGDMIAANVFPEELLYSLALSAGSPLLSTDGSKVQINTPEGIKAIQGFADIMSNKAQVPLLDVWRGAYGNPDSALTTGRVAIGWTGTWSVSAMKEAGVSYMSIPAPIVEGGATAQIGYLNLHAIPASSKHKEAAWELMKWMVSKEGQMSFGTFGDLPVHLEALKETQQRLEGEDMDAFGGFAAAASNVFPTPPFPSDFDALRTGLQNKIVNHEITAVEFAEQITEQGQPMLDKYQANIGE